MSDFTIQLSNDLDNRKNLILVERERAIEAVKFYCDKNIRVLGWDSFTITPDGKRQPWMQYSPDFSSIKLTKLEIMEELDKLEAKITHLELVLDI